MYVTDLFFAKEALIYVFSIILEFEYLLAGIGSLFLPCGDT